MRNLHCVIGRHDWQVKHDKEGRQYEICGRPGCYRVRSHSRSDGPYTHTDTGRPLPPHVPPDGGPGVPPALAGDLGGCRHFCVKDKERASVFFRTLDRG
jgi:hypothetical protein